MHRDIRQTSMQKSEDHELVPNVPVKETGSRSSAKICRRLGIRAYFFTFSNMRCGPHLRWMIPQLAAEFRTTALGVGSILVLYYTPFDYESGRRSCLSITWSEAARSDGAAIPRGWMFVVRRFFSNGR